MTNWNRCVSTPERILREAYVIAYDKAMNGREAAAFFETELRKRGWMIRAVPLRQHGRKSAEADYGTDNI